MSDLEAIAPRAESATTEFRFEELDRAYLRSLYQSVVGEDIVSEEHLVPQIWAYSREAAGLFTDATIEQRRISPAFRFDSAPFFNTAQSETQDEHSPHTWQLQTKMLVKQMRQEDGEIDVIMAKMQQLLRFGNDDIAACLYNAVCNISEQNEVRALVLEAMAGARVARFNDLVSIAIRHCLRDKNDDIRFAAVAAASDLPRAHRNSLRNDVELLASDYEKASDVRRAAKALSKLIDEQ